MTNKLAKPVWFVLATTTPGVQEGSTDLVNQLEVHGPVQLAFGPSLIGHLEETMIKWGRPCAVHLFTKPVDVHEVLLMIETGAPVLQHRACLATVQQDKVLRGLSVTLSLPTVKAWL